MQEKKNNSNNIIVKLKEKKKIIVILLLIIVICIAILLIILNQIINSFDFEKYSMKAQEILYAIEYCDIGSLDSKELKELDNEILEDAKKNRTKEIKDILLNYHMGIGMIADNINTDNNDMIISNAKSSLEKAESEYKTLLAKKKRNYKEVEKKEKYKKIDNYKLSDLLSLEIDYAPELNFNAIHYIGVSLYTGYSNFKVNIVNKLEKEIKYIEMDVSICDKFQDKLVSNSYKCLGPFSYGNASNITFDEQYIPNYKIAKYVKIESVKITYIDDSIITLKNEKIDSEAKEINIHD